MKHSLLKSDLVRECTAGTAALVVAGIVSASQVAIAGESLIVAKGDTVTVSETTEVGAVAVHGVLKVTGGDFMVVDGANAVYIDLGPDGGDVGEMVVTNAVIKSSSGANEKINMRIGNGGGGENAKLRIFDTTYRYSYLGPLTLTANAQTSGERFESLEIGHRGFFLLSQVQNKNVKPLEISFTGEDANLNKFWTGDFFSLTGGGDIILKSVDGTTIRLGGYRSAALSANLFAANPSGMLRTEGAGDVLIDLDGGNAGAPSAICLNSANVAWGHSGNLLLGTTSAAHSGIFRVTADYALPSGNEVIVQSKANGGATNILDVFGTVQNVGSLVGVNGSVITNTALTEAVLTFGGGDADGRISGVNVTNSAIRCEKRGTGCLDIADCALNTLAVYDGTLRISGSVYVGVLAVTNATIQMAEGGKLTVVDSQFDRVNQEVSLPDGVASNCVFLTFPVLGGATAVKDGPGFVTYATPTDANGMGLDVRGGVLRLGGESSDNTWWRLIMKKANGNGRTYTFADSQTKFISVGIGTFGLYNAEGIHTIGGVSSYKCDTGDDPNNAASLASGQVTTKNPTLEWSKSICIAAHGGTSDPILSGANSAATPVQLIRNSNIYSNRYDYACSSADSDATRGATLNAWSIGVMFDGSALDPDDSATWEIITWRSKSTWPQSPVSYAMHRMPNWSNAASPYLTDWELQSSPSGQPGTWVTMDERSNQRWWAKDESGSSGLNEQYQFTYNNHIPYLFKSLNANWRFTTFGAVSVSSGATLDLSELRLENIAFNALKVDLNAGAGTITHFVPATGGTLYLTGVVDDTHSRAVLPLTLGTVSGEANLSSWNVYVNGKRSKDSFLTLENGSIVANIRKAGFILVVR